VRAASADQGLPPNAPDRKPLVTFSQVTRSFDSLKVLSDASFSVRRGEIVGIVGASGSGKTTILKLITGILHPDSGRVDLTADSLGYVFQEPRLLPWRTALDNIAVVLKARGLDKLEARAAATEWMRRTGLAGFECYYPLQLSGGMMQRVSVSRALASEPDLLLMDEPFSNMDRDLKWNLLADLESLARERGTTVVYVTHELPEALRLADRILEIEAGTGPRELDLTDRKALLEAWVAGVLAKAGAAN
jgi:NitT/TauT family transport system ATP-binding protein